MPQIYIKQPSKKATRSEMLVNRYRPMIPVIIHTRHNHNGKQKNREGFHTLCLGEYHSFRSACHSSSGMPGTGDLMLTSLAATLSKYFFFIWWRRFLDTFCSISLQAFRMTSESVSISKLACQDSKHGKDTVNDHMRQEVRRKHTQLQHK